jgi:hypothetical protein
MNLFELLTITSIIAAGYFSGKFFSTTYGTAGWIGGFVFGCLTAIIIYMLFRRLIGVTGKK